MLAFYLRTTKLEPAWSTEA